MELLVIYPARLYFKEFDKEVRRAVGKRDHSSGLGFGERDLQFSFKTKALALAAAERVKKLRRTVKAKVFGVNELYQEYPALFTLGSFLIRDSSGIFARPAEEFVVPRRHRRLLEKASQVAMRLPRILRKPAHREQFLIGEHDGQRRIVRSYPELRPLDKTLNLLFDGPLSDAYDSRVYAPSYRPSLDKQSRRLLKQLVGS